MPTSTLAGQALTSAVVIGQLARCIWIVTFFQRLQTRLSERNVALNGAIERIEALASHDELTGVANRRAISNWLDAQIDIAGRTGEALSVALIDIDHFKRINDTFGHLAGDRTLQTFAPLAAASLRSTDRIGRYGGEEFLVVLPATPLAEAKASLERIRTSLASQGWDSIDPEFRLTITVGAAQFRPGETSEALIRRADLALYLGKQSGRDRVVIDPAFLPDESASECGVVGGSPTDALRDANASLADAKRVRTGRAGG
jgi:diguanylate cyclase (GGDEF)-like protein